MRHTARSSAPGGENPAAAGGPERKFLVVGTAGHIDHGKTQLVRALTGVDTDRLKEEKERGITIDLGFADLPLDADTHLAFIDVPGHERFVRNMLAGAGGLDLILLVIAADESIRPQTREHFDICRLLGIERGLVALTKTDLAEKDLVDLVRVEVAEFLRGSFLEGAPVVPVSARTGAGIGELLAAFRKVAAATPARAGSGVARLPVDRSFSVRGFGTVATGTLLGGVLAVGQEVEVLPAGAPARVRSLEVHRRSVDRARAGQRTAVNLHGLEVARVRRGDCLAPAGVLVPARLLDVRLDLLGSAPGPLKNLARVRLHHGTAEVMARVKLLEGPAMIPGGNGFAQLRLERPVVAVHGDRFILRRYSPPATIGGGRILDPDPPKHRGYPAPEAERLRRLDGPDDTLRFLEWVASAPPGSGTAARVRRLTGGDEAAIEAGLGDLAGAGRLRRLSTRPPCYLALGVYERIAGALLERLRAFHRENPLSPGMPKEEARTRLFGSGGPEFFRSLLADLQAERRVRVEKEVLCLFDHRVTLAADEADLERVLEDEFQKGALSPPTLRDVVGRHGLDSGKAERIFYLLVQSGRLVRIDGGMVFHREALEGLKATLWKYRERSDRIDVGAFKDLTGTTRKSAIPLLEHLDRMRVTRREGNLRVILPRT